MSKTKKDANQEIMNLRPPIITLMGHVDHGKTSLLDAIRKSQITSTESGGITQHIGAYNVEKNGKKLTFIDTPGHEAFTQMRARGGKAADIVVLVVAADDGVMPQTKEAIIHAKAADVPIVVAINKCDLEGANPEKVKKQLAQEEVLVEGYGGEIVSVEVSATKRIGVDDLLDVLFLISEMHVDVLQTDPQGKLEALIIESMHDPKRGIIVSAIVKNGTLKVRDDLVADRKIGKVKLLVDSYGNNVKEAIPGDAVKILGFSDMPSVGSLILRKGEVPEDKKDFSTLDRTETSEDVALPKDKGLKVLNLVIRADTLGTQEAIIAAIKKIKIEDAVSRILFAGIGDVKESDVLLASASRAVVIAFKVGVSTMVKELAKEQKVIVREHDVIYKLLEEIEDALEGVLEIEEAKIKGRGIVIKTFTLPKSGMIVVGTLVEAGKFRPKDRVGIFRGSDDNPLYITRIKSVHVGPKEVNIARKGEECGFLFKPQVTDVQLDDRIEIF